MKDTRGVSTLIAEQNDLFRTSWGMNQSVSGQIVMTQGVAALSPEWTDNLLADDSGLRNLLHSKQTMVRQERIGQRRSALAFRANLV